MGKLKLFCGAERSKSALMRVGFPKLRDSAKARRHTIFLFIIPTKPILKNLSFQRNEIHTIKKLKNYQNVITNQSEDKFSF